MAAKTRKRKSTPTATPRVRRSTRPSRPPRRPDDEFSAATVAAEEPVSTLMEGVYFHSRFFLEADCPHSFSYSARALHSEFSA
jgi:hypothetical protein